MSDDIHDNFEPPTAIVGLGASAGGLRALTEFFEAMPAESGLAFIVVSHQHANHTSILPELLGRQTALEVVEVRDGMRVEPDHVYVSAPGTVLTIAGGVLEVERRSDRRPEIPHLPIDTFFHALALDQRERAIAVILSGAGSDGSIGAKIIKRESGVVMAESASSASYDSMPRSAIATGVVDYVGTPAELGRVILAYAARGEPAHGRSPDVDVSVQDLAKLLDLVRRRTGHDFSPYKDTTLRRRLARRMKLRQLDTPLAYMRELQDDPSELDTLFKDLLIGVTNFFRDPEAYAALAPVLVELLGRKRDDESVRVWVAGCSTGEEAYSLAILLRELIDAHARRLSIQMFATDLDPAAIDFARAAIYPEGIAAHVEAERLQRFFNHEDSNYRVRKDIRDLVVFAPHNILTDPPFTKLDLLSCRNLLIYLTATRQRQLLPHFHYALRPRGLLFLGSSESVGSATELFTPVDTKWKIFAREPTDASLRPSVQFDVSARTDALARTIGSHPSKPPVPTIAKLIDRLLLGRYAPPSVIVDGRRTIVHIHGRTGLYLEPAPGRPSLDVLDMAREGLRASLAACLRTAQTSAEEVRHEGVWVRSNGTHTVVDIAVQRLDEPALLQGMYLVTFRAQPDTPDGVRAEAERRSADELDKLDALERELRYTKETLQTTIEELETSNEELRSTNEELQSTNEELQSTNEELETSKEEMQSLNEELHAVNDELEDKISELSRTNDDMTNLLNSTEIATVFLDRELRIKRFTDSATRVIRLIRTDIGRPIGDLVLELRYDSLVDDAAEVVRTLRYKELELQSTDGGWFLMRMVPYRTTENVIDGLVMTLVDISEQKRSTAALGLAKLGARRHDESLRAILDCAPVHMVVARVDSSLRYTAIDNPPPGIAADAMIGKRPDEVHDGEAGSRLVALVERVFDSRATEREEISFAQSSGTSRYHVCVEPYFEAGEVEGVLTVMVELGGPRA